MLSTLLAVLHGRVRSAAACAVVCDTSADQGCSKKGSLANHNNEPTATDTKSASTGRLWTWCESGCRLGSRRLRPPPRCATTAWRPRCTGVGLWAQASAALVPRGSLVAPRASAQILRSHQRLSWQFEQQDKCQYGCIGMVCQPSDCSDTAANRMMDNAGLAGEPVSCVRPDSEAEENGAGDSTATSNSRFGASHKTESTCNHRHSFWHPGMHRAHS